MIHCFYHSADLDGHCSGAIVKYRFPEAIMHPINYGDQFPWDEIEEDDKVYMVDYCLQPVEDMHKLCLHEANVIWIDHHSSAIRSVEEIGLYPAGLQNTTKAACELTWKYLFPDKPVPLAVKLLSLYDSWTFQGHELEDMVLPFQMRMRMEELDPKDWDYEAGTKGRRLWIKLFSDKKIWHEGFRIDPEDIINGIVAEGRLLLRYDEVQKAKYAKTYSFETGLWVKDKTGGTLYPSIAVNLGHTNSKVFDSVWRRGCPNCPPSLTPGGLIGCRLCKGTGYTEPYDLMITFVRRKDRLWNVSLYSTKDDIDCGAIAKSFGGGGHKGAAGFKCKELPFEY